MRSHHINCRWPTGRALYNLGQLIKVLICQNALSQDLPSLTTSKFPNIWYQVFEAQSGIYMYVCIMYPCVWVNQRKLLDDN